MSDAIIEAAARALHTCEEDDHLWGELVDGDQKYYRDFARCLLAAVTPLIEANALEREGAAMKSGRKATAEYIVREWMLLDATERKMDILVRSIEAELDRSLANGVKIGEAAALEEAAKVAEERERRERDNDGEDVYIEACRDIAYDIRALKQPAESSAA